MSFVHAIETSRKDKTRIQMDHKGEFYVLYKGDPIVIREFMFYKPASGGILDDENTLIQLSPIYLKTCPTIKIPIPVVRRNVVYDNKFFFTQVRKHNRMLGPVGPAFGTPARSGILYIPFLYCYFEETFHEEPRGFIIKVFPKYSSKIDRNLTFVDRNNYTEREDPDLKEKAVDLYIDIKERYRKLEKLENELKSLDPDGVLSREFENMEKKLIQRGD